MRRVIASVLLVAVLVVASVVPAHAGTSTNVALGLASFAVFNQVVGTFARPHRVIHREVVVTRHAFVYAPPVVVYRPRPVVYARPYYGARYYGGYGNGYRHGAYGRSYPYAYQGH